MTPTSPSRTAIEAVDVEELLEFLDLMVATPSPPGGEQELAERIADLGHRRAPDLRWHVDHFGGRRANLLVTAGSGHYADATHVLLGHLDTSLASGDEHARLTGETPQGWERRRLVIDGGRLIGPGVAVAKGPSAAALAALLANHRVGTLAPGTGVLLTSGGTHRLPTEGRTFAAGLRHALDGGLAPAAVVSVKAGPPGILHEEPASSYVCIRVRASGGPALLRDDPTPGAAMALARVVAGVEGWRETLRSRPTTGQTGREVALGALESGLVDKPDLMPSTGSAHLYLVTAPGDDVDEVATDLRVFLEGRAPDGVDLDVAVTASLPAGTTDPDHPLVRLARECWERHNGPVPAVRDWRGSTDGAFLRSIGVPVVRLGPSPRSAPPGSEALDLDDLETFSRIHAELVAETTRWTMEAR